MTFCTFSISVLVRGSTMTAAAAAAHLGPALLLLALLRCDLTVGDIAGGGGERYVLLQSILSHLVDFLCSLELEANKCLIILVGYPVQSLK